MTPGEMRTRAQELWIDCFGNIWKNKEDGLDFIKEKTEMPLKHVIEYSAYQKLVDENERLKSDLLIEAEAHKKTASALQTQIEKIDSLIHKWAEQENIRMPVDFMNIYSECKERK